MMKYRGIQISSEYEEGPTNSSGETLAWAQIKDVEPGTDKVNIELSLSTTAFRTYILHEGKLRMFTDSTLTVPVKWDGTIPHTRERGRDNTDVVFVAPDGVFTIVQVSLVTRRGKFFLAAQEIYAGVAVRSEGVITFHPANAAHAYPEADFSKTFASAANCLTKLLADEKLPAEAPEVIWDPPIVASRGDWQAGIVKWFNPVVGMGMLLGEDEIDTRFHFKDIDSDDPFCGVAPMTPVLWQADPNQAGNCRRAKFVKAIA